MTGWVRGSGGWDRGCRLQLDGRCDGGPGFGERSGKRGFRGSVSGESADQLLRFSLARFVNDDNMLQDSETHRRGSPIICSAAQTVFLQMAGEGTLEGRICSSKRNCMGIDRQLASHKWIDGSCRKAQQEARDAPCRSPLPQTNMGRLQRGRPCVGLSLLERTPAAASSGRDFGITTRRARDPVLQVPRV
jgi:hypothetical protein